MTTTRTPFIHRRTRRSVARLWSSPGRPVAGFAAGSAPAGRHDATGSAAPARVNIEPREGRRPREVPGRARRPRRGGDLDGAQPARPAAGPGARRAPDRGRADGTADPLAPSTTRSRPGHGRGRGRDDGHRARLRPAARRHLPQPAGRPVEVATDGTQGALTCGTARFTPAHDAGRRLPDAARHAGTPAGTVAGDAFAQAVAQVAVAAGRDDTLPMLTGVRVEIEGDQVTLLATDRYRLAMRELALEAHARPDVSRVALVPARTLADTAKALGAGGTGDDRARPAARRRRADRLRGGGRRTTTRLLDGEFPKVPLAVPRRAATRRARSTPAPSSRRSSASRSSPSATPRSGSRFTDGQVALEAGTGDDAQACEAVEASSPARRSRSRSTRSTCSTASARSTRRRRRLSFTQATQPAVTHRPSADGEADTALPLPAHAASACPADATRRSVRDVVIAGSTQREEDRACSSD